MEKEEFRLKYEQLLFIVDRKEKKSESGSGVFKSQNMPTENAPGKVQLSNLEDLGLEPNYELQLERIDNREDRFSPFQSRDLEKKTL